MIQVYLLSFFLFSIPSTFAKQKYDPTSCFSPQFSPGSRYTCNANTPTACKTFIVYHSRQGFNNVSDIAGLFNAKIDQLLKLNNLTKSTQILEVDRDIVLPIKCSCSGSFFRYRLIYTVPFDTTYANISCNVFQGLVKLSALAKANPSDSSIVEKGMKLKVPLKCACPDVKDTRKGFKNLVTYPIKENDNAKFIAQKFGIPLGDLLAENSQGADPTLGTSTTVLVPLRNVPHINQSVSNPSDQASQTFIPFTPNKTINNMMSKKKNLYFVGAGVGLFSVFAMLSGFAIYYRAKKKRRVIKISTRNSTPSCLSPDLIAVMSKYSLTSYTVEELSEATKGFSKETQLGSSVHKARIGDTDLVIKKMGFGDARRTIKIHSKINHASILKLEGVSYGADDKLSPSFLLFEFAQNGCLRDCLKNSPEAIPWHTRTQIAFDVAVGLHYIHHCTVPSYIHMNITSKNILITGDWRAKIANLGAGSVINSTRETTSDIAMISEGWIAPECIHHGVVSEKVDVFAYGVVLFEILSAIEVKEESFVRERLCFLGGEGGGASCFDELRRLLDPILIDYPIGEALCVAVLAKACVEEDPMHRPSMNDILKILARMVR